MFVTRFTFIKFIHIVLVYWCIILILCEMIHELLTSNMQKSELLCTYMIIIANSKLQ